MGKKRVRLKIQETKKKKVIRVLLKEIDKEEDSYSIPEEYCRAMRNYFVGYKRIGAVSSSYSTRMGDRIEIYDLGSVKYVGAIYPDGASMLWPMVWWAPRIDSSLELDEDEQTYSSLIIDGKNAKRKRVKLKNHRAQLKRVRVKLNG